MDKIIKKKLCEIEKAWKERDLLKLKELCVAPNGLISNDYRKQIWPLLLEIDNISDFMANWKDIDLSNSYSDIIQRDIDRSLYNFDICESYNEEIRKNLRIELSNIVNGVIKHNPDLHYFQGFHSICSTFLLIGGEDLGFKMSSQCALLHIKDSMRKSFEDSVYPEMMLIYKLLRIQNSKLAKKLESVYTFDTDLNSPMFSLSWILTWLSHNIVNFNTLCRVFDFMLGTHPLAPVYITSAIILTQKKEILSFESMPDVHQHFSDLVDKLDMEAICADAFNMMLRVPPENLVRASERKFPEDSALKGEVKVARRYQKKQRAIQIMMSTIFVFLVIIISFLVNRYNVIGLIKG
ncbi:TBC1D20 [Blepharisma stoltei]|uniref:Rab-GAP TBC domain-containing protein n=1 Tax=Blepharisma stoltei TaxID=1481888 RepID=A0AAU9J325_9CILI|nr:unnamed protein product [Blepharisma stoltei]